MIWALPSRTASSMRLRLKMTTQSCSLAVIWDRDPVLAIAEHVAGLRILLHAKPMHRGLVWQLDDLIALHDVEAHASDARVRLVVHEHVAPVVGALRERGMRMVEVAVGVDPALVLHELAVLGR